MAGVLALALGMTAVALAGFEPAASRCSCASRASNFGSPLAYPVDDDPYGIAAARLNGDNGMDIATANCAGSASVLLGN